MIRKGFYICPYCRKVRLAKVARGAGCRGVILWCKLCKRDVEIIIPQNNMREPEP